MTIDRDMLDIERELGVEGDDDEYQDDIFGEDDDDDDDTGYIDEIGDDDDDVGRRRRSRRRRGFGRRRRRRPGRKKVRVRAPGNTGDYRLWHLPATGNLALAAGASGTLTFTPNRNISIIDMILGVFTAAAITRAATYPEAIAITNITVQGRTQFPGTGNVPMSSFLEGAVRRYGRLTWENCMASQSVIVSFTNNDAATTHNVTGCLVVETVW